MRFNSARTHEDELADDAITTGVRVERVVENVHIKNQLIDGFPDKQWHAKEGTNGIEESLAI